VKAAIGRENLPPPHTTLPTALDDPRPIVGI
jgi:hypothetical protein